MCVYLGYQVPLPWCTYACLGLGKWYRYLSVNATHQCCTHEELAHPWIQRYVLTGAANSLVQVEAFNFSCEPLHDFTVCVGQNTA